MYFNFFSLPKTDPPQLTAATNKRSFCDSCDGVVATGLRQRTAIWHICSQHPPSTGCAELTGQNNLPSSTVSQCRLNCQPVRRRISYKLAVVTYKTRTTSTPTYLSQLIHDYNPGRDLRSADNLLLRSTVLRTSLALSAKAFSVSAPAVWNSLI